MSRGALALALAAAVAVGGLAAPASAAPVLSGGPKIPAPACGTVFDANKARIESLAEARDIASIRAIFTKAGCDAPSVSLPDPLASRAQMAKLSCKATLLPPAIICTFGIATKAPNAS